MKDPEYIIFRVDASLQIGSGHVMRCLALADALVDNAGVKCFFVCRLHDGNMAAYIKSKGHHVLLLSSPKKDWFPLDDNNQLKHATWLGASMADVKG